jgi:RNA polymerase sigma-54 factor
MGNSPTPPPSLNELLLTELRSFDVPEKIRMIAEEIIYMLDQDGFLRINSADLAMVCDCSLSEAGEALLLVQNISPPGVGARDLPESLRLQLQHKGRLSPQMEKLLAEGMDDIAQNRLPKLAAKLGISMEELKGLLAELRQLDPAPGRRYTPASVSAVRPELEITSDGNGSFKVVPSQESFRRITVSPLYEKLSESPDLSADDRKYLQEKIARAKELITALESRDSTLKQLGEFIMHKQHDFLLHGKEALKPMTMREAGEFIKVGESTISRAVADKYITTPHGVLPLKYFFSGGYGGDDGGEAVSSRAVMEKIKSLIASEDPFHPLSDDKIAALLRKQNLNVARRTVAKYRDILKIPGSSLRKKH